MTRRGRGEGNLYKRRDGLWVGRVSLGLAAGKRRRKVVYGKTRKEAAERLTAIVRAQQLGQPISSDRQSVGDYLERWLTRVRPTVRPSTYRRYCQLVRRQLVVHLGRVPLSKLAPSDLGVAYSSMSVAGLHPRTVGHAHRVLARALRDAEADGLVARNVARLTRPPRVPSVEMATFTVEQARQIITLAREKRLGALFVVALSTGMRQGELLALKWSDLDLEAGVVRVCRTLQRGPDGFEMSEPKTASARRALPLGEVGMAALRQQRRQQVVDRVQAGPTWHDADLVFSTEVGTPIDARNLVRRHYRPLLRELGLPQLTFHSMRHTMACLLIASGTHIRVVAERLGHADPALTLRTYSHVAPGLQAEATASLDALLSGNGHR